MARMPTSRVLAVTSYIGLYVLIIEPSADTRDKHQRWITINNIIAHNKYVGTIIIL